MGWCSFGGDTETIDGLAATPTMLDPIWNAKRARVRKSLRRVKTRRNSALQGVQLAERARLSTRLTNASVSFARIGRRQATAQATGSE